jgi:hypothetical protein
MLTWAQQNYLVQQRPAVVLAAAAIYYMEETFI